MPQVTDSIDVHAPISAVYALWTRFEEFPRFMSGVESITQQTDTQLHWVVSIAGVEREFDAEITEQHPDERVAWRSTDGETHAGVVTFHRIDDASSRVMVQMDWEPEGMLETLGKALGSDDRRVKSDLERFKELVESRGTESGAWRGEIDRGDVVSR